MSADPCVELVGRYWASEVESYGCIVDLGKGADCGRKQEKDRRSLKHQLLEGLLAITEIQSSEEQLKIV
jgi:hypothetical protein